MINFISGISVWAAYGVLSAAGVILCSRMKETQANEIVQEKTHFSVEGTDSSVYNEGKN